MPLLGLLYLEVVLGWVAILRLEHIEGRLGLAFRVAACCARARALARPALGPVACGQRAALAVVALHGKKVAGKVLG